MRPSASCELWTPCAGLAVNYAPACFGRPCSAQDITTFILHPSPSPLLLDVSLTVKPHASKISFSPTVQWGHLSQSSLDPQMNWNTSSCWTKVTKWVILIFKKIMTKKRECTETSLMLHSSVNSLVFGRQQGAAESRKLWV